MLIVHPHFHPRRTGITTHVELMVQAQGAFEEVRIIGQQVSERCPRVSWWEIWRRAASESVVWHAHRNNELIWGLLLRFLGRPSLCVVATCHRTRPGRFTRWLLRRASAIVTLNRQAAQWLKTPSTVIQHGVDLERFEPAADKAPKAVGLSGTSAVGVIGRIRPAKGQGDFVEAVTPLLEKFPHWVPVCVGLAKGADVAWAEQLRHQTGGRLVLPGEQKDVVPWYQALSIVVHPSHDEAFSMVLMEAMASGCCVVATRIAAVPDVIEHDHTGFLFEPGDVTALRAILEHLMTNPGVVERVGRAAREQARKKHGLAQEAQSLLSLYRQTLETIV